VSDLTCWCGQPADERHHLTARVGGEDTPYLDPELWVWTCHDDHSLASDDQLRMADWETDLTRSGVTRLDRLEVRLRRVAAFLGRLAKALGMPVVVAIVARLATHIERWAVDLAAAIAILDSAMPGWRTLPGMNG
jgi:hypothetical protein